MSRFKYTVVNKEGEQLSGSVTAADVEGARKKLQELGFSIVSLEQEEKISEKEADGSIFEFSGRDPRNRQIKGTIESEDRYIAFKRLIKEYDLEVEYIVQSNLTPSEKAKQKKSGVKDLLVEYQNEVRKKTDMFHKEKIKTIDRNFEKEKARVMRQVDFVMRKVNEAVDSFATELNPQDKQTIKNYVNKILRIKSSTNLEYIKNECKKLLEFLQNAEIFAHKKEGLDIKVALCKDAKTMIEKMDKNKEFEKYETLRDKISSWKEKNIDRKEKKSIFDNIISFFLSFILKSTREDKKSREIKEKIHKLNNDIKQYYSIYLKNKSPDYKKQAIESAKQLKKQKKELKKELYMLEQGSKEATKQQREKSFFEHSIEVISGITGWLLFFYLIFYFTSNYIIEKQVLFPQENIPGVFYVFQTGSIRYVLPIIFLLHVTAKSKMLFFRKNLYASLIMFPVFLIASLIIAFNF